MELKHFHFLERMYVGLNILTRVLTALMCICFLIGGLLILVMDATHLGFKLVTDPEQRISLVKNDSHLSRTYVTLAFVSVAFSACALHGILKKKIRYIAPFMAFQATLIVTLLTAAWDHVIYEILIRAMSVSTLLIIIIAAQIWMIGLLSNVVRTTLHDARVNTLKGQVNGCVGSDLKPLNIILNMNVSDSKMIPTAVQSALMISELGADKVMIKIKANDGTEHEVFPLGDKTANPPPYTATLTYENEIPLPPPEEDSQAPPPYTAQDQEQPATAV